jgi:CDP-diacylglycerol--glycerol-3-phosphate 3-phosphatidyltransferase
MSTWPNRVTLLRFAAVPVLFVLSSTGKPTAFITCLVLALATDVLDGFLARRMGLVSEFGARLDTFADLAIYIALPICAWRLWPELLSREIGFVVVAVLSYALPVLAGLTKYGRVAAYHTWSAKLAAVVMAVTVIPFLAFQIVVPFRFATAVFALAGIENIAITVLLPEWIPNVKSIFHALRIKERLGRE